MKNRDQKRPIRLPGLERLPISYVATSDDVDPDDAGREQNGHAWPKSAASVGDGPARVRISELDQA